MATLKTTYGSTSTLTITLTSLANANSATSSTIDNTTDLFLDALVEVVINTAAGATAAGYLEVYAKGSVDNSDFDDDNNDKWIGTINLVTAGAAARKRIFSVASSFGGVLPAYWQVRVRNVSGAALPSSNAGTVQIRGVSAQSV